MKELVNVDALKLFCWHAFRQNGPDIGYEELSKMVVQYAQGVPLAIKILGSFLFGRSKGEWESKINKLERTPPSEIQKVLKVSYDGLDDNEQNIFLDIACFFKGKDKDLVVEFLDASGLFAEIGISILVDRSLIIVLDNKIKMHDLLQAMGREIVRQESNKNPGKRSRLWHHDDIYKVLTYNTGTQAIEGISLDMSKVKNIRLYPNTFTKMHNLRFLKFYSSFYGDSKNKVLIQDMELISMELRYLYWLGYPLKSLPIHPENLVSLKLLNSKVEQLWDAVQSLVNLKKIDLCGSKQLTKLPDLSKARNLEKLILKDCSSLVETHSSIQYLNKLVILNLRNCESLTSLTRRISSKSLEQLILLGCSNLKTFPEISACNLEVLYLDGTAIEGLPSSIDCLSKLVSLHLENCQRLKSLPSSLFNLKSLKSLYVSGCSSLNSFPDISSYNLEELHLEGTAIEELPSFIVCLSKLHSLHLQDCKRLQSLPSSLFNLKSLQFLFLSGCSNLKSLPKISSCNFKILFLDKTAIEELPSSICCLSRLKSLYLEDCKQFQSLPGSLFNLECLRILVLSGCSNLKKLPHISSCNLEELHLAEAAIKELPSSIEFLTSLVRLDLRNCSRLESLPSSLCRLKSLEYLTLSGCSNLQRLPDQFGNALRSLDAEGIAISEVPSSIVRLKNLEELSFLKFRGHEQMSFILPTSVSLDGLHSLSHLKLVDCGILELPESLGQLSSLEELYLDKNNFVRIPESIINLSKLERLHLSYCKRLQSLPNLPCNLQYMDANHCSSLEGLSGLSVLFTFQTHYQSFVFRYCLKLDQNELKNTVYKALQKIHHVATGKSVNLIPLYVGGSHQICYPGSEIPEGFKFQSMGSSTNLELSLGDQFNNEFVGFGFCVIVAFEGHQESEKNFIVQCQLKVETEDGNWRVVYDYPLFIGEIGFVEVDHVILSCDLSTKFEYYYNNEAIFEFYVMDTSGKRIECCEVVKKCGISVYHKPKIQ